MLIRFAESQMTPATGSKRTRIESSPPKSPVGPSSGLWNDDTEGINMTPVAVRLPRHQDNAPPPRDSAPLPHDASPHPRQQENNDLSSRVDEIMKFLIQNSSKSEARDQQNADKLGQVLDVVAKLTERNEKLELSLQEMEIKFQNVLQRVETIENEARAIELLPTPEIIISSSTNDNIQTQPINTPQITWASIAKSAPSEQTLSARAKAITSVSSENRKSGISALTDLATKRTFSRRPITETKALYIGGFSFQKLSNVWNAMRKARFQTSRIVEIQWIGKTVLEFIVAQDYALQFSSEMEATKSFRILDFNPASNTRATSEAQAETTMRCFAVRCAKNIVFGNTPIVKEHFNRVADKAARSNPKLKEFLDAELQRASEARESEIAELEAMLSVVDTEITEEQFKMANRLQILDPLNTISQQILEQNIQARSAGGGQREAGPATSDY
jgi:hypothetical protein